MLTFDQELLKSKLSSLNTVGRAAFAVACAERLYPLYKAYSEKIDRIGDDLLYATLRDLWELALGNKTEVRSAFLEKYESLIPGDDADWDVLNPLAENAVAALAYACRCHATAEIQDAVWAATQVYEAVDYVAQTSQDICFKGPDSAHAILSSNIVQGELQRQLRDIAELEASRESTAKLKMTVNSLKNRAKIDGADLVRVALELLRNAPQEKGHD